MRAFEPIGISIHALLAESDKKNVLSVTRSTHFYPRSPCGERRLSAVRSSSPSNFYPRSPCGERRKVPKPRCRCIGISIHALLAESDFDPPAYHAGADRISIHALLAESDALLKYTKASKKIFLSTLSLRRATRPRYSFAPHFVISIHALLAESDCLVSMPPWCDPSISIHALLAESD